ncbi:hypothetical protein FOCC_FOCC003749 [Frankliniella occidentalis]|nr:hypothetical protein FOCC_FOCC003749 [Frankliniella occidentalis]
MEEETGIPQAWAFDITDQPEQLLHCDQGFASRNVTLHASRTVILFEVLIREDFPKNYLVLGQAKLSRTAHKDSDWAQ